MKLRFWRGQLLVNDLGHERKQNLIKVARGTALTKCQDAQTWLARTSLPDLDLVQDAASHGIGQPGESGGEHQLDVRLRDCHFQ